MIASPEAVTALRARLEVKHEELIKALLVLVRGKTIRAPVDSFVESLLRRLGIVTYWRSLTDPSEHELVEVNQMLDGDPS